MKSAKKIELKVSEDDDGVAYLTLPGHPGTLPGIVKKSVQLRDLIDRYVGPDLVFDFDENDQLIGVEILI